MTREFAPSIFVHIVAYNSAPYLVPCLRSVLEQDSYQLGQDLFVRVTDNASRDDSVAVLETEFGGKVEIHPNTANLGFCGGHNQGVRAFLDSSAAFLLILNPDVRLERDSLRKLASSLASDSRAGMACARLMRSDAQLNPVDPAVFDSAGIVMTPSLRHFDRGSGEVDSGQYRTREYVFGGTGACLLLKRECVLDLLVEEGDRASALFSLYPQLRDFPAQRAPLFDEAFFAYREDADLAWRAELFGWKCIYEPLAVAYHKRVVLPERRSELPDELNKLGVRNRFLLQLNNFTLGLGLRCLLEGLLIRNLLVILGVLLRERSSLSGLAEAFALAGRAWERRRRVFHKARDRRWSAGNLRRWFQHVPFAEKA
ncbi:MAG: glycosyltransferase family 2 protein [Deltaproteobacteria bacterium]|nr:glycosyltransferase family 2 protein [Deltaproteobacteria bacterium]